MYTQIITRLIYSTPFHFPFHFTPSVLASSNSPKIARGAIFGAPTPPSLSMRRLDVNTIELESRVKVRAGSRAIAADLYADRLIGSCVGVKGKGKGLGGSFTKPETTQIPFVPSQLESTHEGSTAGQLCSFMSSASFFLLAALLLLFLPRPLLSLPYSVSSTKKRSFHVPSSHSCTHCHSFPDSRFESRRGILRRVRRRRQSC